MRRVKVVALLLVCAMFFSVAQSAFAFMQPENRARREVQSDNGYVVRILMCTLAGGIAGFLIGAMVGAASGWGMVFRKKKAILYSTAVVILIMICLGLLWWHYSIELLRDEAYTYGGRADSGGKIMY